MARQGTTGTHQLIGIFASEHEAYHFQEQFAQELRSASSHASADTIASDTDTVSLEPIPIDSSAAITAPAKLAWETVIEDAALSAWWEGLGSRWQEALVHNFQIRAEFSVSNWFSSLVYSPLKPVRVDDQLLQQLLEQEILTLRRLDGYITKLEPLRRFTPPTSDGIKPSIALLPYAFFAQITLFILGSEILISPEGIQGE